VRELAEDAGTTTRAVYSLFGSKDGLLGALGAHAFDLLREGLEALPVTRNPRRDVLEAALMFRRFALEHPALFSIGIQRADPTIWPRFQAAAWEALGALHARFVPLAEAGLLAGRSVGEAAMEFHALCEGLAALELRGLPPGLDAERIWRDGFHALIAGFAEPLPGRRARRPAAKAGSTVATG
jgi:AcrR family transcriptional regulator